MTRDHRTRARGARSAGLLGLAVPLLLIACHDDETVKGLVDREVTLACAPDQCTIDGACWDNGAVDPTNPCLACVVLVAADRLSPNDAGACDDGDRCTHGDVCRDGACVGAPRDCADDNPCTLDGCDPTDGACTYAPAPDKCGEDPCAAETPPDCDDDNVCTDDRCEPWVGCVNAPVPEPAADAAPVACDDGDPCTSADACVDGECRGAAPTDCDDGDLCTIDLCRGGPEGGCEHRSIASLCKDDNPCTDERCEPDQGCIYPFNTDPCTDDSLCTANDTCASGVCVGTPVPFDDGNPCTDDACDPLLGVINAPNRLPCDDLDACTVGDYCADAVCRSGATPLPCDDANVCTDDACDPASGCTFTNHTRVCNDQNACTSADRCAGGDCLGQTVDCDDDNACTLDSCNTASGCVNELVVSNACRPTITVTSPARGATLTASSSTLTITGTVSSGAGPITFFQINGVNVPVAANGSFSRTITPTYGGNILVFVARDSFGSERRRVQSFLWSNGYRHPTTPKNGIVTQGLGVWLDKLAIDDGNRSSPPNDLASIIQIVLRNYDFGDAIPRPVYDNYDAGIAEYDLYVENLTYNAPTATLTPQAGGIRLVGRITSGRADIRAQRVQCDTFLGICAMPGQITGDVTFTSLTVTADLTLGVSSNDISVTVASSNVQINGLDVQIDGLFGWLAEFILDFFLDDLTTSIETQFNNQLRPIIRDLVRNGLRQLAFQVALDVPKPSGGTVPIDLVTDFSSIGCSAEGCRIIFRSGGYSDSKVTPFTNSGVPNRANCNGGTQTLVIPEARILELSLADDMLNQLLFAAWRGGLLEFPVPSSWLTGVDLSQYGITNLAMVVSGMLAPTASDCSRTSLGAHLGDLKVTANMRLFNQPVTVVMWGSIVAGVSLSTTAVAGGGNEITLRITSIERLETQIDVVEEGMIGLEPVIRELIEDRVLTDVVSRLTGQDLGSFPLPDIDLSGAIAGLPAGTRIRILPEVLTRSGGNTIAGGRLY